MHHYRQFAKLYAPTPRSGSRRYWRGRSLPRCVRLFSSRTYPKTIARRIGSRGEPVAFLLDSTTGLDVRLIVIKAASLGYCRGLCAGSPYSSRWRSEEHTSELPSLMRTSYAVFCLKQKNQLRHQDYK